MKRKYIAQDCFITVSCIRSTFFMDVLISRLNHFKQSYSARLPRVHLISGMLLKCYI